MGASKIINTAMPIDHSGGSDWCWSVMEEAS